MNSSEIGRPMEKRCFCTTVKMAGKRKIRRILELLRFRCCSWSYKPTVSMRHRSKVWQFDLLSMHCMKVVNKLVGWCSWNYKREVHSWSKLMDRSCTRRCYIHILSFQRQQRRPSKRERPKKDKEYKYFYCCTNYKITYKFEHFELEVLEVTVNCNLEAERTL